MGQAIKITCEGAATVPYQNILDFQGELKDLAEVDYERLKKQILDHGFNSPIHVWKQGQKLWNLDGHQRVRVLQGLENEGYKVPDVPVDYIKAKNIAEAKQILLSRVSQFGKVTPSGLYDYMRDADLSIEDVKNRFTIPDIDMEKFDRDFFQPPQNKEAKGSQEVDPSSYSKLVHECPKCGFRFGKGASDGPAS